MTPSKYRFKRFIAEKTDCNYAECTQVGVEKKYKKHSSVAYISATVPTETG